MIAVRRTPLDVDACLLAARQVGAIYFIRDADRDCVKIGHSRWPLARMATLQVGNPSRLSILGVVAAQIEVEPLVHGLCSDGHARGEWFYDRGIISAWLEDVTECRHFYGWIWDEVVSTFLSVERRFRLVRRAVVSG